MERIIPFCLALVMALSSCLKEDYILVSFTEQEGTTFLSWSINDTTNSNYFDFFYACSPRLNTYNLPLEEFDIYLEGRNLVSQKGNGEGFFPYDWDGSFNFKEIENLKEMYFEPIIEPVTNTTYIYLSRENGTTYYTKIRIEEHKHTDDYHYIKFMWLRSDSDGKFRY